MHINLLRAGTAAPIELRLGTLLIERAYLGSALVYGEQEENASHTVFGVAAPSYTIGAYVDGMPSIECGNVFYLTDASGPAIGWRCKGARVWIPNDPSVAGKPIALFAYIGLETGHPELGGLDHKATKVTVTPAAGGWCEVEWDESFAIDYGPTNFCVIISYRFTEAADQMKYIAASGLPTSAIPSTEAGATLVLAETAANLRGKFRIGTADTISSAMWYGADIIVEEAPTPSTLQPVAAYNFNEGGGTSAGDATGHGYALATQSQYFTASGHTGGGLQQTAASNYAIDVAFTALDTAAQPEFTIMFWGKYDSAGTPGTNWTIEQTVENYSNTGWGIAMSDGTNAVFGLRVQGFDKRLTAPKQPVGQWHHYALTRNGYYTRAYIDGVMIDEDYQTGIASGDSDHNIRIFGGSMQSQTIDDLRFFTYTLNADGIQYYMNRGA